MRIEPCVVVVLLPLLLGMRDPFSPVVDPCRAEQLSLLHYGGGVETGQKMMGFVRDETGTWRRVERDSAFNYPWRISHVTMDSLTIDVGAGCEPLQWRIIRKGSKNDKKEISADVTGVAHDGNQQKRVAGRGRGADRAGAAKPGKS